MPSKFHDKVMGSTKRRVKKVTIVVDGEPVDTFCWSFTEAERSKFEMVRDTATSDADWKENFENQRRRLIAAAYHTELGEREFDELDVEKLEGVDSMITGQLYEEALRHIGYRKSDIEELAKNSVATGGGESS